MAERPGPKPAALELTAAERASLQALLRRGSTSQARALRARIVLACADGHTNGEVAAQLGVSVPTVAKWRNRFNARRLAGLADQPRPGVPRTITDDQVNEVLIMTVEVAPPDGAAHWSTRTMAQATGLSQSSIARIWRRHGIRPGAAGGAGSLPVDLPIL